MDTKKLVFNNSVVPVRNIKVLGFGDTKSLLRYTYYSNIKYHDSIYDFFKIPNLWTSKRRLDLRAH